MNNDFIESLDKEFKRRKPSAFKEITDYHNARALICLYDEVYNLRLAINRTNDSVGNTIDAINNASAESTDLGKKIVALTWVIAIAAALGVIVGFAQLCFR